MAQMITEKKYYPKKGVHNSRSQVEQIFQEEVEKEEEVKDKDNVEEDGKGEDEHDKSQDILDPSKLRGGKRLKRAAMNTKSPYVVYQQLREQLRTTLPTFMFVPFKPVSKKVAIAFAVYMKT